MSNAGALLIRRPLRRFGVLRTAPSLEGIVARLGLTLEPFDDHPFDPRHTDVVSVMEVAGHEVWLGDGLWRLIDRLLRTRTERFGRESFVALCCHEGAGLAAYQVVREGALGRGASVAPGRGGNWQRTYASPTDVPSKTAEETQAWTQVARHAGAPETLVHRLMSAPGLSETMGLARRGETDEAEIVRALPDGTVQPLNPNSLNKRGKPYVPQLAFYSRLYLADLFVTCLSRARIGMGPFDTEFAETCDAQFAAPRPVWRINSA